MDWSAFRPLHGMRRIGKEWHGPCPVGNSSSARPDGFWVNPSAQLFGCRPCGLRLRGEALRAHLEPVGIWTSERESGSWRAPVYRKPSSTRGDPTRVARLWSAAGPVTRTPGAIYLAGRGVWPGVEHPAVRWLPASSASALRIYPQLPTNAAGCLAYAFLGSGEGEPGAIQVEAVDGAGARLTSWRFRDGPRDEKRVSVSGSAFAYGRRRFVGRSPKAPLLWICEGPLDALALALMLPEERGVIGVSGTAGFKAAAVERFAGKVVIAPDGDEGGTRAGIELASALKSRGQHYEIVVPHTGLDWCDVLRRLPNGERDPR